MITASGLLLSFILSFNAAINTNAADEDLYEYEFGNFLVYSEEPLNLFSEEDWHRHDYECDCDCWYDEDEYEGFGYLTIQTDKPLIISNKTPEEPVYGRIDIYSDCDITLKNIDINGYVNIDSNSGVITLEGDNRIYDSYHGNGEPPGGAINLYNNSLEIKGDGKLTLESPTMAAIYSLDYGSSLVISGGTLDLKGAQYGIYTPNVTINGGDVTATGDLSAIGFIDTYCEGSITINDGTVTANGGIGGGDSYSCVDTIKITGGTVVATCMENQNRSSAIGNAENIIISGGNITADGGENGAIGMDMEGYGVAEVEITGGTIIAKGTTGIGGKKVYIGDDADITATETRRGIVLLPDTQDSDDAVLTIDDGIVNIPGICFMPNNDSHSDTVTERNIYINGGEVNVTCPSEFSDYEYAGINTPNTSLIVTGGTLNVSGGYSAIGDSNYYCWANTPCTNDIILRNCNVNLSGSDYGITARNLEITDSEVVIETTDDNGKSIFINWDDQDINAVSELNIKNSKVVMTNGIECGLECYAPSSINIENSIVTTDEENGQNGIVHNIDSYYADSYGICIDNSSVKTYAVSCDPKNKAEETVYLNIIENPQKEVVKIDGVEFPFKTHSENDTNLYIYMPARTIDDPCVVNIGEETVKYYYDTENSEWAVVEEAKTKIIESGNCGENGDNVTWALYDDGTLIISGEGATTRNSPWDSYRNSITNVVIENGITSIGNKTFYDYNDLASVTIENGVKSIGDYAFCGCDKLTSIEIPDSVTSIGDSAFEGCYHLTSATIPNGVTYIGEKTFKGCYRLSSITIPDSVTSIGDSAFEGCSGLASVTIPDSVTSIGEKAFYNCSRLTSITIPDSVTSIGNYAFYACFDLVSVTISEGVETIGNYAFSECDSLTSVNIPSGVESIGNHAFDNCSTLTSVTIPSSVTSIGNAAFINCYSLTSVTISEGVTTISSNMFRNCPKLTSIEIPDSVTSIGRVAFYDCKNLSSITIPDSVSSIGDYAFYNCKSLTSIEIPDGVTLIDNHTFYGCSGLNSITISDSIETIEEYAFYECLKLTSVTIPESVTSIGDFAFKGCSKLTSVIIPGSVKSIGEYAFYNCNNLASLIISEGVESIGDSAFQSCSKLTSITIPSSVTSIPDHAFQSCSKLASVTIPDSVTSIGDSAFFKCSSLTSVTIPGSVKTIDDCAFRECSNLTSVAIPEGVESIGIYIFYDCENLTSVTIPSSLKSIGNDSFSYCTSLENVYLPCGWNDSIYKFNNSVTKNIAEHTSGGPATIITPEICTVCGYIINPAKSGNCGTDGSEQSVTWALSKNGVDENGNNTYTLVISGNGAMADYVHPWYFYRNSITKVVIENDVTSIGNWAFANCSDITSVTIPASVRSIGNYAFSDCSKLTSVAIPSCVESIGNGAFHNCSGLTSATISEGVETIGNYAFDNCSGLTSVTIPSGVESIGNHAFDNCSNLTSVTIPGSVTSIGKNAFSHCSSLTSVTIPSGITSIKEGVFSYSGLTSVTIPEDITSIEDSAFANCRNLTSVTIPDSVVSIEGSAFATSGLTSVIIPENVKSIGDLSFYNCPDLVSVTILSKNISIGKFPFDHRYLENVYLPCNWSDSIYKFNESITKNIEEHISGGPATPTTPEICTVCGCVISSATNVENNNSSSSNSSSSIEIENDNSGLTYDRIIVTDSKDHTDENDFAAGECVKVEEIVIM